MNQIFTFGLVSTALIVSAGQVSAATFTIDNFTTPSSTTSSGGAVTDSVSDSSILGGTRLVELDNFSGGGDLTAETKTCTAVVPLTECMTFSGESGVSGALSVIYGSDIIAGIDVTAGGFNDTFRVATQFSDFPANFDIIVSDTSGNTATFMSTSPGGIFFPLTGTSNLDVAFSAFSGDAVDFSNIDLLEFAFETVVPATDLEFSLLSTENVDPTDDPDPSTPPSLPTVTEPRSFISLMGVFAVAPVSLQISKGEKKYRK